MFYLNDKNVKAMDIVNYIDKLETKDDQKKCIADLLQGMGDNVDHNTIIISKAKLLLGATMGAYFGYKIWRRICEYRKHKEDDCEIIQETN